VLPGQFLRVPEGGERVSVLCQKQGEASGVWEVSLGSAWDQVLSDGFMERVLGAG
jgi:hypothetical protein